jgi:hypothetical protein
MTEPREPWLELGAVPIALAVTGILLVAIVGIWVGPWTAALVLLGYALTVITGLVVWSDRRAHPPAADAPHVKPIADERYRILVVADTPGVAPGLPESLRSRAAGRPLSVFVTTPALESRFGHLASDQHGYDDAAQRLHEILRALRVEGLEARGAVGPDDPLQAADDGLRQFPADEILFVTNRKEQTNWLEDGVVELAGSRYDRPVEHMTVV